ncbi:MAG: RNA polymerase sigma factor RpoE [Candidatus Melainabacteria bacterium]|nr:MAG: RNA polymerase sigma factor RpoE [Candidatus Melainabacteria bacterium]
MISSKPLTDANFEELALSHSEPLFRLAFARVGNAHDAEDILQETFIKAYRNFKDFRYEASFKNWLSKILINTIRDHFRKSGRSVETVEWDDAIELDETLTEPGPEHVLCDCEVHPELMTALSTLPEQLQVPLLLREIDEASYEEIAQILDVPKGTVMSRLFRARALLRKKLCNLTGSEAPKDIHSQPNCERG